MKISKLLQWLNLLMFIVLGNGCTTSNNVLSTQVTLSATPIIVFPDETITPTRVDTVTPVPTLTLTSVPALATTFAHQVWFDLLANNDDCKLPCFWNITPGKSDYRAARNILMPLS